MTDSPKASEAIDRFGEKIIWASSAALEMPNYRAQNKRIALIPVSKIRNFVDTHFGREFTRKTACLYDRPIIIRGPPPRPTASHATCLSSHFIDTYYNIPENFYYCV